MALMLVKDFTVFGNLVGNGVHLAVHPFDYVSGGRTVASRRWTHLDFLGYVLCGKGGLPKSGVPLHRRVAQRKEQRQKANQKLGHGFGFLVDHSFLAWFKLSLFAPPA